MEENPFLYAEERSDMAMKQQVGKVWHDKSFEDLQRRTITVEMIVRHTDRLGNVKAVTQKVVFDTSGDNPAADVADRLTEFQQKVHPSIIAAFKEK